MVGQHGALHSRMGLWQHKRLDDVGRDMPSSILGRTHGQITSGVAFPHGPWAAHIVERRQASHGIIALKQHTASDDIEHGMPS